MDDYFKSVVDTFWSLLEVAYEQKCAALGTVQFDRDKKDFFYEEFERQYCSVGKKYMSNDTQGLDRHKLTAIAMVTTVKSKVFVGNPPEDYFFWGIYRIAVDIGLSYMLDRLNNLLGKSDAPAREITGYFFPEAFSCPTPYPEIFARNLYYLEKDGTLDVIMELSEKLFLLEYIAVLKNSIDTSLLKTYSDT